MSTTDNKVLKYIVMMRASTKTKERVRDLGEVFTQQREVTAMLNLVRHETRRIESRFLEPACGNGNFLAPVLARKLLAVEKTYKKSQLEYERNVIVTVGSIYGIDIMQDNVAECRKRLYDIFEVAYKKLYKKQINPKICESAWAILQRNILWGDALSLKTSDPNNPKSIIFSEWSRPFNDSRIKRHDYDFEEIVTKDRADLFHVGKTSDTGEQVYQIRPVKSFPLIHMTKLKELT